MWNRIINNKLIIVSFMALISVFFIAPFFMNSKYISARSQTITMNVRNPEYTIVFHSNGGNGSMADQPFVYGTSQALTANSFTYAGRIFKRWNTAADGSGTNYSDEQVVNNLTSVDGATINLYAQWAPGFTVIGNPTNWTNQDVTLTVVLGAGSYSDYQYSFNNGSNWSNSYQQIFSSNQDVYVKIKDNDGYQSEAVLVSITKIDKVDPVITYGTSTEYNADHTTNTVTTLIAFLGENTSITTGVTVTDNLSGVASGWPKCYRGNTEISSTNYFTNVGRYEITCKVQDNAGNETTESREVLIRWPLAGQYVVARTTTTEPSGYTGQCATNYTAPGLGGTGLSSTTSPSGLYADTASTGGDTSLPFASKYYYTGPTVDNYISFAGTTFRILNIPTNDDIKVLGDVSDKKVQWGASVYPNKRMIYNSDIYSAWSTTWWPNGQIYDNVSGESKYKLFTATEKAHLDLATFYAGRFNKNDATDIALTVYYEQTGAINLGGNNNPAFEGYSAFPNVSDYLKASRAHDYVVNIDNTQDTTILGIGVDRRQLFNDNSWIDMSVDQWTMNSKNLTNTDNDFWVVDGTLRGRIMSRTFYYDQQYRVVFYLKSDTILSGVGTSALPYNVEEDWAWFDSCQVVQ